MEISYSSAAVSTIAQTTPVTSARLRALAHGQKSALLAGGVAARTLVPVSRVTGGELRPQATGMTGTPVRFTDSSVIDNSTHPGSVSWGPPV